MRLTKAAAVRHICDLLDCEKLFAARVWKETQAMVLTDVDEGSSISETLRELEADFRYAVTVLKEADKWEKRAKERQRNAERNRTRPVRLTLHLESEARVEKVIESETPADILELTPLRTGDAEYPMKAYTVGNVVAYGVADALHAIAPALQRKRESILYLRIEAA